MGLDSDLIRGIARATTAVNRNCHESRYIIDSTGLREIELWLGCAVSCHYDDRIMPSKSTSDVPVLRNALSAMRRARGWSQGELAARAGISRAAVSSIEVGSVTPSVRVALELARVLGVSVEEIFEQGGPGRESARWAWPPRGTDGGYWIGREADGIRHYPVEALSMNSFPPDGMASRGNFRTLRENPPPTLTLATCDPAANLLAAEFGRRSGARMLVFPRNTSDGLDLLCRGAVAVAGLHASTPDDPGANLTRVRETLGVGWVLVRAADWHSGFALPSSDRTRSGAALARGNRRWALREPGAVARESLEGLLGSRKPRGRVVRGHREVAEAVRAGWANAGVCVEWCAAESGLNFVRQRTEALDFVFHKRLLPDMRIQKLLDLLESRAWRAFLATLPGYVSRNTGERQFA